MQGSVLGLLLYLLYAADIGPLLTQLGLLHHLFADDVQAYVHTDPLAAETVLTRIIIIFMFQISVCQTAP